MKEETAINHQLVKTIIVSKTNGSATGVWFSQASYQAVKREEIEKKVFVLGPLNSDREVFKICLYVPVTAWLQMMRHKVGMFTEPSQRCRTPRCIPTVEKDLFCLNSSKERGQTHSTAERRSKKDNEWWFCVEAFIPIWGIINVSELELRAT